MCKSCRARQELSNEYFLSKFGVDAEENEPYKVCSFGWKIRERFDIEPSTKVPALIKCLKDRERYVRNLAVTALGNVGEHAGLAVPALTSDSDA